MTLKEVADMINEIGLPYAYYSFPERKDNVPELPYILYYYPSNNDLGADNINYQSINALNIELYCKNKDFNTEELVETVLTKYGFYYQKTESYLNSEHMYEVLYESEVVINGK